LENAGAEEEAGAVPNAGASSSDAINTEGWERERLMSRIRFAVRWFEEIIASFLLALTLIVLFLGIVYRYALNDPLTWTEELARFCSTWIIFLGAAACFKHRSHIGIDVVVRLLPPALQRGTALLVNWLMMAILAVLVVRGFQYTSKSFVMHTTVLQIPVGLWNAAVPVGSLFMIIRLLQLTLRSGSNEEVTSPLC
jgi:TRAP-type C4-dicarboxylate transport system permease small subunit